MDAVDWRGLQQIVIVMLAGWTTFLGYRLYRHGLTSGPVEASFRSRALAFTMAGPGPGILFMLLGSIVMISGVWRGDAVAGNQALGSNITSAIENVLAGEALESLEKKVVEASDAENRQEVQEALEELLTLAQQEVVTALNGMPSTSLAGSHLSDRNVDSLPLQETPPSNAPILQLDSSVSDNFVDYADRWYRVQIDTAGKYSILTLQSASGAPVDTEISLYSDALRSPLGQDDDCGQGTYSYLSEDLQMGIYYLRVSSYSRTQGSYNVAAYAGEPRIDQNDCLAALDDSVVVTDTIEVGGVVTGVFSQHDEADYFFLSVPESGSYQLVTSGSPNGVEVDTEVSLFSATGNRALLGYDDDGGESPYSMLVEELIPGDYYILVSSYWGMPGTYSLVVEHVR